MGLFRDIVDGLFGRDRDLFGRDRDKWSMGIIQEPPSKLPEEMAEGAGLICFIDDNGQLVEVTVDPSEREE